MSSITTGKRAKFKANVFQGSFNNILIWDPGSGYSDSNPCNLTITDTAFVVGLEVDTNNGITIYKIQVNGVNKAYTVLDGNLTELEII